MLSEVSIVLETLYVLLESWGWLCHAGNGFPARTGDYRDGGLHQVLLAT